LTATPTGIFHAADVNRDFNEYTITLEYWPENRHIRGFQRVQYTNRTPVPLSRINFNLFFNAFSGDQGAGYEISNIFVNGTVSRFSLSDTRLTVFLPFLLLQGREVSVDIHFVSCIPETAGRTGANEYAAWFGNFVPLLAVFDREELQWRGDPVFPVGTPFFSRVANFTVRVTTPHGYRVVGTGDASIGEAGDRNVTAFSAMRVRDFAFALSENYSETTRISEAGVHITTFLLYDMDKTLRDESINMVLESLDYFSEIIGPYPYKALKIAETGYGNGIAVYPMLMFINTPVILEMDDEAAAAALITSVAKQWFYGIVGHDPIREAWLSNGLSYYTAAMFMHRDDDEDLARFMGVLEDELRVVTEGLMNTAIAGHIMLFYEDGGYNAIQTFKAALMFHYLREVMGGEAYGEFLKIYYRDNYLATASAEGLVRAAEEAHGECLREFFDIWLNGEGLPEMRLEDEDINN